MEYNIETERAYACMLMHDDTILYQAAINPDDIQDIISRKIVETCKTLSHAGTKVDLQSVCFELKSQINPAEIAEIHGMGALHVNWKFYTDKLSKKIMHDKIEGLFPFVRELINAGSEPTEIVSHTSEYLDNIITGFRDYKIEDFSKIIPQVIKEAEDKIGKTKVGITGTPTGIPVLDELTQGFKKKELIYIGARPSDGKSAALNGFVLAAHEARYKPGIITVESSAREIVRRCISSDSRTPLSRIKSGTMFQSQIAQFTDSAMKLYDNPAHIYDEPNADMQTVLTQARRMVSVYGCDCLYVDYIQQITPSSKSQTRHEKVADMSKALKSLARELDIPIVVASQLVRPQKGHENKRPVVSDFAESSQIEKDADIAIMIWHKRNPDTDMTESFFLLEKQRDGETRDIPVYFNKEIVRFEERNE